MMIENYNKLTPEQTERLAYLAEECGEVIQIVGKILRHGYSSFDPTKEKIETNDLLLTKELTDVLQAMTRMKVNNDLSGLEIQPINYHNLKFWHHQKELNSELPILY